MDSAATDLMALQGLADGGTLCPEGQPVTVKEYRVLAHPLLSIFLALLVLTTPISVPVQAGDQSPLASKQMNLREELELTASMVRRGDVPAARANIERVDHLWDVVEGTDKADALMPRIVDRAIDRGIDRVFMTLQLRTMNLAGSERALKDLLRVLDVVRP